MPARQRLVKTPSAAEKQPVFTQSGTYTFILGANLHVDDPALVHKVTVKYVHKARPASDPVVVAMQ